MKTLLWTVTCSVLVAGCASEHQTYLYAKRVADTSDPIVDLDGATNPIIKGLLTKLEEKDLSVSQRELIATLSEDESKSLDDALEQLKEAQLGRVPHSATYECQDKLYVLTWAIE